MTSLWQTVRYINQLPLKYQVNGAQLLITPAWPLAHCSALAVLCAISSTVDTILKHKLQR
jgi:hypothetical protein